MEIYTNIKKTQELVNLFGLSIEKEFILFINFLAALAVLHWTIWIIGWIATGWFEGKEWIHPTLQNRPRQIAFPQTEATTFPLSSIFILLLWSVLYGLSCWQREKPKKSARSVAEVAMQPPHQELFKTVLIYG